MEIESVLLLIANANFPFSSVITPLPELWAYTLHEMRGRPVLASVTFPVITRSCAFALKQMAQRRKLNILYGKYIFINGQVLRFQNSKNNSHYPFRRYSFFLQKSTKPQVICSTYSFMYLKI